MAAEEDNSSLIVSSFSLQVLVEKVSAAQESSLQPARIDLSFVEDSFPVLQRPLTFVRRGLSWPAEPRHSREDRFSTNHFLSNKVKNKIKNETVN
jgi:hypothetical protein